jgi:hypothetical protein
MANRQNGKLTTWQVDKISKWQVEKWQVEKWQVD